jgi:PIN domain nuclease of toxin-antitoxin system
VKALLDTHAFLWWIAEAPKFRARVARLIADPDSEILVSVVSFWEIALKTQAGKLELSREFSFPGQLRANGFRGLDLQTAHVEELLRLPMRHKDPFDRMLIAQARAEDIPIVSADGIIRKYDVKVLW